MSITIGSNSFNYKTNKNKYIITYISDYNTILDSYIDTIFHSIFPFYSSEQLKHSNVCGANAEFVCNNLKIDGLTIGKIIITNWIKKRNIDDLRSITSVYGSNNMTIGATYHALVYVGAIIEENEYYVAIETTICEPYKLQFYVGTNSAEFESIITSRYQCNEFKLSFDCDKSWFDIAFKGGKKLETKNTRKLSNNTKTKRKHKRKRNVKRCKNNGTKTK